MILKQILLVSTKENVQRSTWRMWILMSGCIGLRNKCKIDNDNQKNNDNYNNDDYILVVMIRTKMTWSLKEFLLMRNINKKLFVYCQVGGNSKAKAFFKSQPDFRADMSIQEKYNSRAAALYRDKVWFIPRSGPLFLFLSTSLPLQRLVQLFTIKLCTGWAKSWGNIKEG